MVDPTKSRGTQIRRPIFCALNACGETKIPFARYLIDKEKEDWVEPEILEKVQLLKSWKPTLEAPGFGDTDDEDEEGKEGKPRTKMKSRR